MKIDVQDMIQVLVGQRFLGRKFHDYEKDGLPEDGDPRGKIIVKASIGINESREDVVLRLKLDDGQYIEVYDTEEVETEWVPRPISDDIRDIFNQG